MSTFFALLPLFILSLLLLIFGVRLLYSSLITATLTLVLVFFHWQTSPLQLGWGIVKGIFLTFDIFLIVLGALLFQGHLKKTGNFKLMISELQKVSSRPWILILVLSWCFGAFLEGISGFGAPAALLGPFLIGLGLLPLEAIVICLLANSTAVTFGAMGTPIRVGLSEYVTPELISITSIMNLWIGVIIPILMIYFLRKRNIAPKDSYTPYLWAIAAGIVLLIPYFVMSQYAIEFPSVIGGAVGFFSMIFILKLVEKRSFSVTKLLFSFYPYWPVIILLFIGRYYFAGQGIKFQLGDYFSHTISYFHPGLILLLVVLILGLAQSRSISFILPLIKEAKSKLWQTTLSLFFMSLVSTLFLLTEFGDQRGMLSLIGDMLKGDYYRYYTVFVGALGSFLTGSATISNLLFGALQAEIATSLELNLDLVLALQLSGAAMGNMISLLNIISVEGALNVTSNLKEVFSYLLPYCFVTLLLFAASQMAF